ncbi:MAG: hypothetical protein SangKO_043000 [Sandaracinaceae bacterium]
MRSTLVLAQVLAFALAACGPQRPPLTPETRAAYHDLRVAPERCREPAAEVTRAQAVRDLNVLERVLTRGYAGYGLHSPERVRDAMGEARGSLPDSPLSPAAFREHLFRHIAFLDDNHVGLWFYDDEGRHFRATSQHRQAYLADARFERTPGGFQDSEGRQLVACGDRAPEAILRPVAAPPSVAWAPILLSPERVNALSCTVTRGERQEEVVYPARRLGLGRSGGPPFERADAPFPWLRVRTLAYSRRGALEAFVESAEQVRDAPVVVLDLRRAGGGSDRFLVRWFSRLTSRELSYWAVEDLRSEVTLQGALNFWGCVRSFSGADAGGREWLDGRVGRAERELSQAMRDRGPFRDVLPGHVTLEGRAPTPFTGKLILLVDRGCASACETSVMLARQIPGAIVVGENTEGTMKVGELRWYRLPESGLWLSAGTRVHRDPNPNGGFAEGRGFLPDLWLDGRDVDATVRALATCLTDGTCAPPPR